MISNNNNNCALLSFGWLKWCNFILNKYTQKFPTKKTPKISFSFLYFPTITHAHSTYRFSYFSFPKYLPLISNELGAETYISKPKFRNYAEIPNLRHAGSSNSCWKKLTPPKETHTGSSKTHVKGRN